MAADIDKRMVFAYGDFDKGGGRALMIGLTAAVWDEIKSGGIGHDLDLTSIGLPMKLIIFGGADHSACMKVIEDAAKQTGVALLDERRKDFSIKGG